MDKLIDELMNPATMACAIFEEGTAVKDEISRSLEKDQEPGTFGHLLQQSIQMIDHDEESARQICTKLKEA